MVNFYIVAFVFLSILFLCSCETGSKKKKSKEKKSKSGNEGTCLLGETILPRERRCSDISSNSVGHVAIAFYGNIMSLMIQLQVLCFLCIYRYIETIEILH